MEASMAETPVELVGYEVRDRVAHLTLNRPPLNVLNLAMLREMEAGLGRAAAELGLAALLVGALGGRFCAGGVFSRRWRGRFRWCCRGGAGRPDLSLPVRRSAPSRRRSSDSSVRPFRR